MFQADKNEALKKALFCGDVSLIEELLNSGEESQLQSWIFLCVCELGKNTKLSHLKQDFISFTGSIHMFLHALNTLFWKIKLLFQWLRFGIPAHSFQFVSFVSQEPWKLRRL